ncbi:hypothetical protein ABBQ38_008120 [Trebouxia sp. C0009 RCD-2024]
MYAIVADKVEEVNLSAAQLLHHFHSLSDYAKQKRQQMPPQEVVAICWYTTLVDYMEDNVMAASSVDAVNVATITSAPAGHSWTCIPMGLRL